MTDRTPDPDDATLHADLDAWFKREVREAAADLRRSPLRPARARAIAPRGVAGPAAVAILVVVLVAAGVARLPSFRGPLAEPTGSAPVPTSSLEPSTSVTVPPSTSPPTTGIVGRYQDGIPARIDGERVLRPPTMETLLPEGESFLIGGWLSHVEAVRQCLTPASPLEPCANPILNLTPGFAEEGRSVLLEAGPLEEGPVVIRAHINDQRATGCAPTRVPACRSTLVAEAIIWTDDAVTRTAPISTASTMNRLGSLLPGGELQLIPRAISPELFDPAITCDPGLPVQTWTTSTAAIAMILVFQSVAAREAVDDNFNASGWRGTTPDGLTTCLMTTDSFFSHEWVISQNVMVAVNVDIDGATPTQQTLIDGVAEALGPP